VSYADDLDAKMADFTQFIAKEKRPESNWTGYHRLFNRYLYTGTMEADMAPEAGSEEPPPKA
jgi:hypothetical protein